MKRFGSCLAGLLAATLVPAAEPPAPWAPDGRCVAQVCVGDSAHTARRLLPAGWSLGQRASPRETALEWRDERRQLAARFVLEDEPAPSAAARRIARIDVHRAGSASGVDGLLLGDPVDEARLTRTAGAWALPEQGLRWWTVQRAPAPGADSYPLNLGLDAQQRLVRLVMNGKRLRETRFQDLDQALAATRARLQAMDPTLAAVPEVPAAAMPPMAVHVDLLWLPQALALRFTSRPDCTVASCEVLRVDVGGRAPGAADGRRAALPGAAGPQATAYVAPTRCGGSCSPATVAFTRQGRTVRLQFDARFGRPGEAALSAADEQALMLGLAASALR